MKTELQFTVAFIATLFFLLIIIFGNNGFYDLTNLKKQEELLIANNLKIKKENNDLFHIVQRLKSDSKYIEEVARHELGMIGQDEFIFKFNKITKKK